MSQEGFAPVAAAIVACVALCNATCDVCVTILCLKVETIPFFAPTKRPPPRAPPLPPHHDSCLVQSVRNETAIVTNKRPKMCYMSVSELFDMISTAVMMTMRKKCVCSQ